jgi:hypothetical protein
MAVRRSWVGGEGRSGMHRLNITGQSGTENNTYLQCVPKLGVLGQGFLHSSDHLKGRLYYYLSSEQRKGGPREGLKVTQYVNLK